MDRDDNQVKNGKGWVQREIAARETGRAEEFMWDGENLKYGKCIELYWIGFGLMLRVDYTC